MNIYQYHRLTEEEFIIYAFHVHYLNHNQVDIDFETIITQAYMVDWSKDYKHRRNQIKQMLWN